MTKIGLAAFADSGVKDIYYGGSSAQWEKVNIAYGGGTGHWSSLKNNQYFDLKGVNIHYNSNKTDID